MKKIIISIVLALVTAHAMSQIQRKITSPVKDSTSQVATELGDDKMNRPGNNLAVLKELDLTKAQKQQLKTMRQENKAQRESILNDATLTEEGKQQKLKALKLSAAKSLQSILTVEQRTKLKDLKKGKKADSNMEEMP